MRYNNIKPIHAIYAKEDIMITIGNAALDNGMPKICVPIVGRTVEELIQECRYLQDKPYDVVELRIDFLADTTLPAVGEALAAVRKELPHSSFFKFLKCLINWSFLLSINIHLLLLTPY